MSVLRNDGPICDFSHFRYIWILLVIQDVHSNIYTCGIRYSSTRRHIRHGQTELGVPRDMNTFNMTYFLMFQKSQLRHNYFFFKYSTTQKLKTWKVPVSWDTMPLLSRTNLPECRETCHLHLQYGTILLYWIRRQQVPLKYNYVSTHYTVPHFRRQ